jgi:hypothetical protein
MDLRADRKGEDSWGFLVISRCERVEDGNLTLNWLCSITHQHNLTQLNPNV